jgi:amino acid adenylation domain-containing protein/FkbM family methyltransferase
MSEISQRIEALSPEKLALLSRRLKEKTRQRARKQSILRRADSNLYPLSLEQQRLWFMNQLQPNSSFYNMGGAMRLTGDLKIEILEQTLSEIARRHEVLRSSFPMIQGVPAQVVAPPAAIKLKVHDLRNVAEREEVAARMINEEIEKPFDLANERLFRTAGWRLGEREHVLLVVMHHIIGDGWSIGVFLRELVALYRAFTEGSSSPLPELSIQYADYAAWQQERLTEETLDKQLNYWKRQLKGSNAALNLPVDFQRPAVSTNRGGSESFHLSPLTVKALDELGQQENGTLFMTLLAAYYVLLYRYTGQQDINLGTPVLGRNQIETEQLIGFFINALVLRGDISGNPTFLEFLQSVRELVLDAQSNQDVPFAKVVEALQPERTLVQMPLCQAVFRMENIAVDGTLDLPGLTISPFPVSDQTTEYDLICSAARHGDEITVTLIYSADLFNAATINRLGTHFQRLLDSVVSKPEQRLSDIQFLDETECRQVLGDWNATTVDYPKDKCIQQLFEAQVEQTPNAIALVFEDRQLTYDELNSRANQLAHHLRDLGVQNEMLVGLCMERSIEMIVGMLGILKAGAAFVPLDPGYPIDRLSFMFEDARLPVLLTQEQLAASLPCQWVQTICLDSDWDLIATRSEENLAGVSEPDNLAYVIYTSGSTGKPKGVMLQHTGLGNMVRAQIKAFGVGSDSRVLQFASFSFDASVSEVFMALLAGARLYLGTRETLMPGPALLQTLRENEITVVTLPPSVLAAMGSEQLPALEVIIAAGESCSLETVERWTKGKRFFDAYGPTEDTVCATLAELDGSRVTIGGPIANNQIYILDQNLQPLPAGVFGELHIGGVGLARGYLNRPDLTAEKFIANPFGAGSRIYKTGDLARWFPDGKIDFFGRIDHQLKVRGYRIEAGEIEAVLNSHPEVSTSVVIARENSAGEKRLTAYCIPRTIEREEFISEGQIELWPSVAEFYVYDDLLYLAMTADERRNESYKVAINRHVKEKVVLDIGTGKDAILARFCVEAGAKKVYAIELLKETYDKAKATIESLGLTDRIALIHGNSMEVELPEKIDVCVSEIVGPIGGVEGAAPIINNAWRFMKEDGVMIPERSLTRMAAVTLPEEFLENPSFTKVAARYVDKVFEQVGYKFDLRLCLRNFSKENIVSNYQSFEDLDFSKPIAAEYQHEFEFVIDQDTRLAGFVLWLNLYTVADEVINILEHEYCWLPVYLPVFYPVVEAQAGDVIKGTVSGCFSDNNLNLDYTVNGTLFRQSGEPIDFEYTTYHHKEIFRAAEFHKKVFPEGRTITGENLKSQDLSKKLKAHLKEVLPEYMIPSYFVMIDALPLTPNGKIDHRALPAPNFSNPEPGAAFAAPRNQIEEILAASWSQGLNVSRVGIDDNFFELGGDSIRSVQVLAKAQEHGLEVSVQQLFKYQTIRKLGEQLSMPAAIAETLPRIEPFGMICTDDRQKMPPHVVDAYPLTAMQAGMVFQSDLQRGDALYHAVNSFHLRLPLDRDALQRALQQFAELYEVLRISFDLANFSEPLQLVHDTVQVPLAVDDLRGLAASEQEKAIAEWLKVDRYARLDLSQAPLLRFHVHRRTDESLQFTFTAHHAIFDGWSDAVFLTELLKLYLEILEKGSVLASPLAVSFRDYVALEKEALTSAESQQFWMDWLSDADTTLAPSWSNSPLVKITQRFDSSHIKFTAELGQRLNDLARSRGVTLKSILLAAHLHICALLSGRKDVVTGLVSNGRPEVAGGERILGLFLNTLPFRARLNGGTWEDLIQETFTGELNTVPHRRYPLAQIQHDNGGQTLFDTCFNYTHFHVYQQLEEVSEMQLLGTNGGAAETEFAVSSNFNVDLRNSYIELHLICDTHQLHPDQIRLIGDYYIATLEEIAGNPQGRYEIHSPLTPAERQRLLIEWNDTAAGYSTDTTVPELFEVQAERSADAVALRFEGEELSYQELNGLANQLARYLRQQGVGAESRVGISMSRSFDMWIAVLGVLKAGAAYVPLDPGYPQERIAYMVRDSKVEVLLTQEHLVSELPAEGVQVVCLDADWDLISGHSHEPLEALSTAENLAYVIYTSGSTGLPKGVAMTHRALVNLMQWQATRSGPPQRTLQFASLSFDVSFQEAFSAWSGGGSVVLISEEHRRDGRELLRVLMDEQVERLCVPFVALNYLAEAAEAQGVWPRRLRQIMSAGEQLKTTGPVRRLLENLPGCTLDNQCGPSETHAAAALMLPDAISEWPALPPIGRPLANVRFYVLDERMQLVPAGVPGELYIAGVCHSRGYLDRPEMTAERYVPNPFSDCGERLFRSGDIVRYLPSGDVEWLWRKDEQVKIRGFRVELGEIENLLAGHESVSEVCVVAREEVSGDKRLVAYVVGREGQSPVNEELRNHLQERLPVYMIPSAFVVLEKLPLTPSGKVNRRALPVPEASDEIFADGSYEAPRNPLEELLCSIWAGVLRVREVGVTANFFKMGGHSLLAIQLISRVREALRVEVSLQKLFDQPTVRSMAEEIEEALRGGLDLTVGRIEKADRNGALPLSYAQQRLWFIHQLDPSNVSYNIPMSVRLKGSLDIPALERTLTEVVRRHESLRTTFSVEDGEPVQVIHHPANFKLELRDFGELSDAERESETHRLVTEEAQQPFDLAAGPLMRASLIKLADDEHVLLATMHHIISDGWSMNVLVREVATLYEAYTNDATSPLPELEMQYADFAAWQRSWLEGEALDKQLSYWREQLSGSPAVLELPADRPRPAVQSHRGATRSMIVPAEVTQTLKEITRREGVTLFMTLLAAWQTLLSRYSGQTDIVVGSPVANRNRVETEVLIGFFVNTLVLRSDLAGDPTFRELLKRVRGVTVGGYAHQDVPFEKLVEELQPTRSMSHSPLFQVMFTLQNISVGGETRELPELQLSTLDAEHETAKFDLTLAISEAQGVLDCTIEYKTDLFDASTIEQMLHHFSRLLESAAANPHQRLSELQMLDIDEQKRILIEFNNTATEFPSSTSLHDLFEQQVQRTPENIALVFENQQLTYSELNTRANQLAHRLRRLGVGPDVLVGVMMERSIEMVVALLCIIKAGGAYVPLDPEYPEQRLSFMMADAGIRILLSQSHLLDSLPQDRPEIVITLNDAEDLVTERIENPVSITGEQNLAYCIYTSGSTGRPKGAMNTHAGICNRLHWMQAAYQLNDQDRVLQKTTFSFDVSVWEFFWPLITGARLVMARPGGHRDSAYLVSVVREQAITTMHFVPSMLQVFLEDEGVETCGSLKQVVCSGEALPFDLQQRFFTRLPEVELHNLYGPTEAAVDVTSWACNAAGNSGVVPIGKAIANTGMYILDPQMNAVPPGVPGELYIGGVQLARGYLNRPQLTAEKFVPHPFSREGGERLYRTGDLGTFQPDGNIRYLGRLDHQMKLRGFRIEPGEIEATLTQHPAVHEAVVMTRQYSSDDLRLIAYVVPDRRRAMVVRRLLQMEREGSLTDTKPYKLPNGMAVFHQNKNETDFVYDEIFEQHVYLKHGITLAEGDCVFDVGANIGMFTLFVGQHCRDATIYAFEPIPPVFDSLRRNVELYDLNVTLLQCGVSARTHEDTFAFYPHASLLSSRYTDATEVRQVVKSFLRNQQNTNGEDAALPSETLLDELVAERLKVERYTCQLRPLSEVIREFSIERIDLLKIDVEKSELDVLAGIAEGDWPKIQQMIVEVHDIEGRLELVSDLLRSRGYRLEVDQDRLLEGTGLYNVYAVRPSNSRRAPLEDLTITNGEPEKNWMSADALLAEVQGFIKEKLPSYMIPSAMVLLESIPLTPNGKLDRGALPEPVQAGGDSSASFVGPRDDLELQLVQIWQEVLDLRSISVKDNFFDRGGHSLLAVRLLSRVRRVLNVELPLSVFFKQQPTIEQMAVHLRQQAESDQHQYSPLVEIQRGAVDVPAFFCVHPSGGNVLCYARLARHLGLNQSVYGVEAHGVHAGQVTLKSVPEMAASYIKAMRTVQPVGPYQLGGWSMGGLVAYEMAHQLQAQGLEVSLLALIDTSAPPGVYAMGEPDELSLMVLFAQDMGLSWQDLEVSLEEMVKLDAQDQLVWLLELAITAGVVPPDIERSQIERLYHVFKTNVRAMLAYEPEPFQGRVTLFKAEEPLPGSGLQSSWEDYALEGVEIHSVPGNHFTMIREPHVRVLARALAHCIANAETATLSVA